MEISLITEDGRDVSALFQLIELRKKELGETTKQSCLALTQNVLRSLRGQTKIADAKTADLKIQLASGYVPSWKREAGSKRSRRVLRAGIDGPEVNPDKVIWNVGKFTKGEELHAYTVVDQISPDKSYKYILVSKDYESAEKYAKKRHKKIVENHKGLARLALSLAMKELFTNTPVADKVNSATSQIAQQNFSTKVSEQGFNSGIVEIEVHDKLNYAELALQGGPASVQTAMQNALNKMVGFLEMKLKQKGESLDSSLKIDLQEIVNGIR